MTITLYVCLYFKPEVEFSINWEIRADTLEAIVEIIDDLIILCLVVWTIDMSIHRISSDCDSLHMINKPSQCATNYGLIAKLAQLNPGIIVLHINISSVSSAQSDNKSNLRVSLDPVALVHKKVYKYMSCSTILAYLHHDLYGLWCIGQRTGVDWRMIVFGLLWRLGVIVGEAQYVWGNMGENWAESKGGAGSR